MLALTAFHILKRNRVRGINTLYRLLSGNVCMCVFCIDGFVWVCTRMHVACASMCMEPRGEHQVSSTRAIYLFMQDSVSHWTWSSLIQQAWLANALQRPLCASQILGLSGVQVQVLMLLWQTFYWLSHPPSPKPTFSCHFYCFLLN